jgi:DNA-binding winged helix-turn-helix (wHTH) protein/tetratricopeptide (TPR) repeat protein
MIFQFGGVELNTERFSITREGQPVPVEPKVFDLLVFLIRHRDRLITRDQLFEELWPDRVVSDNVLSNEIKLARAVLDDDGKQQKYIRTVRGRGYQFVGDVLEIGFTAAAAGVEPDVGTTPPATDAALASIAVVPFAALSADEADHYTARAISAEIAIALSRLTELRVAPTRRLQPDQGSIEPHAVAAEYDVQYVLTGSLRRKANSIRIIAELNDLPNNRVLWSEAYEQSEDSPAGTLEEEIAAAIVGSFGGERLRIELSRALENQASENPVARDYVYRARAYLLNYNRDSVLEAEALARKAVELDGDSAAAHAVLASVLAEKATGGISAAIDRDMAQAIASIESALRRAPEDSFILKLAGSVFTSHGELDRAEAVLRRAAELTPFDLGTWGYLACVLAARGGGEDAADAHRILDRITEMAPRHPGIAYWMHHKALAFSAQGLFDEAADYARRATDRQPGLAWAWYLLANARAMNGDIDGARDAVARATVANPELTMRGYAGTVARISGEDVASRARLAGLAGAGLYPGTAPSAVHQH